MNKIHNPNKLIILIAQLILLGGCVTANDTNGQSSNTATESKVLSAVEKKCLTELKDSLDKYLDKYKETISKLNSSDVTGNLAILQSVSPKAKVSSSELKQLANRQDCKSVTASNIKDLPEVILILEDLSLEKTKDENTRKKVGNTKIIPSYITEKDFKEKESEILFRQFIQYTDDKISDVLKQLDVLLLPDNVTELRKQNKDLSDKLKNKDTEIEIFKADSSRQITLFAPAFLILLLAVGAGGYFLGKNSQSSSGNPKPKERSRKPDPASKSGSKDVSRNRRGLGNDSTSNASASSHNPINESSDRGLKFRLNEKNKAAINDISNEIKDRDDILPNQKIKKDETSRYQRVNPSPAEITPRRASSNQSLTYDVAVQYYQSGDYDLLQAASQGYYSATSESMMRNREFWENPLELVEAYNGLFWIVQTIEPYFLLLPNPLKRIAETRLPGIEYFFETNFKDENYRSCVVVSPAYMGNENGKWVMQQKGQINFIY